MGEEEEKRQRPIRVAALRAVKREMEDSPPPPPAKKAAKDRANSLPPTNKALPSSIKSRHPPTVSIPQPTVSVTAAAAPTVQNQSSEQ